MNHLIFSQFILIYKISLLKYLVVVAKISMTTEIPYNKILLEINSNIRYKSFYKFSNIYLQNKNVLLSISFKVMTDLHVESLFTFYLNLHPCGFSIGSKTLSNHSDS